MSLSTAAVKGAFFLGQNAKCVRGNEGGAGACGFAFRVAEMAGAVPRGRAVRACRNRFLRGYWEGGVVDNFGSAADPGRIGG